MLTQDPDESGNARRRVKQKALEPVCSARIPAGLRCGALTGRSRSRYCRPLADYSASVTTSRLQVDCHLVRAARSVSRSFLFSPTPGGYCVVSLGRPAARSAAFFGSSIPQARFVVGGRLFRRSGRWPHSVFRIVIAFLFRDALRGSSTRPDERRRGFSSEERERERERVGS